MGTFVYDVRDMRHVAVQCSQETGSVIDREGAIAAYFDQSIWTNASMSLGAVYLDGTLCVHPPRTRHGTYPYPEAMRHGVFSVTKSLAGALAMFHFAQRPAPWQ